MANRYWVGGTGNWDASTTTHWGSASGVADNASVPTSSDDVIFDTLSNATAYTCTVTATANCANISFTNPLTGALTFAGSSALNVAGNFTIVSAITRTYTGVITFSATATGKTVTLNSISFASAMTFNGVGGGWTLQDTFITTGTITVQNGTLNTNNVAVTANAISMPFSGTKVLTLGSSTVTLTGSAGISITTTNTTLNANTSTILLSATNTTVNIGGLTLNNLTYTGPASTSAGLNFTTNATFGGTFTVNGANGTTQRALVKATTMGTSITITAATVTITNCDFQDITGAGAGSWNLSAITGLSGDCGGNSGITFTTPQTQYWVGGTGSWATAGEWGTSTGGSGGRVPLPQDDVVFDANSFSAGSQTVTQNMQRAGKNITFAGDGAGAVTNTPTFTPSTAASLFGSLTLVSGMTLTSSTSVYVLEGRGTYTITNAGKTWGKNFTINAFGGSYTIQDDFTSTGNLLTVTSGTFNANNFNVSFDNFGSSGSITRVITMGSGTWTFSGSNSPCWNISTATNLTLNSNTSTIKFTDTSTNAIKFTGGAKIYNIIWFDRGASTGHNDIDSNNTIDTIKDTGTEAHSLRFVSGTTQTLTGVTPFQVSGTVGKEVTINTLGATTTHTLTKSGGGTISCDYLNIQHSVATPTNTWYAGANSTDNQAVSTAGSGWIFTVPPAGGSNSNFFKLF